MKILETNLLAPRAGGVYAPFLEFDPSRLNPVNQFGIYLVIIGAMIFFLVDFVEYFKKWKFLRHVRKGSVIAMIVGAALVIVATQTR